MRRYVADEGATRWSELKASLKHHVEGINDGLQDGLLSYSDGASGNELTLRHELRERNAQVAFDPASAVFHIRAAKAKVSSAQVFREILCSIDGMRSPVARV